MDGSQFDELSKRLVDPLARRPVAKGLGGGLIAGLLALAGIDGAAAAPCHKPNDRCGHGRSATCCIAPDTCGVSNVCQTSTLTCPVGGDASDPSYRCNNGVCDCGTAVGTNTPICFTGGTCSACMSSLDCAPGFCVTATLCANGTACVNPCV